MKHWPADKVERKPVSSLVPSARNARTHSDAQVAQIAASIREWGWTMPVLIDDAGGIIAGHGRILAADKLGLADVPCMTATDWTDADKRAYALADNKLAMNAGWDDDLLAVELQGLAEWDADLALTGFSEDEIADLTIDRTQGLTDPDAVPETPDDPVTVLGDTWLLGKHRLRCGDSTSADDVAALLNGVEPHLMVTDPPYGVEYDPAWRSEAARRSSKAMGTFGAAARAEGKVTNDDRADWREAWALFPGDVAYVWHAGNKANVSADSLIASGFEIRAQIVWVKDRHVISLGDYQPRHEPLWYAVRKGKTGHYGGDRKQTTVWDIRIPWDNYGHRKPTAEDQKNRHGTQKPVECMRRPIVNNSSPGQAVYEPFSGSGTTIIAGEMESRAIYAMEITPAYVDVACKRWQEFTGETVTLEATGEPFKANE